MSPPADGLPHAAGITASPTACLVGSISVCFPSREHSGAPRRVGLGRGGSEAASAAGAGGSDGHVAALWKRGPRFLSCCTCRFRPLAAERRPPTRGTAALLLRQSRSAAGRPGVARRGVAVCRDARAEASRSRRPREGRRACERSASGPPSSAPAPPARDICGAHPGYVPPKPCDKCRCPVSLSGHVKRRCPTALCPRAAGRPPAAAAVPAWKGAPAALRGLGSPPTPGLAGRLTGPTASGNGPSCTGSEAARERHGV